MISNHVQRQIEDIQGQVAKRLQELPIIVLLLLIPIFFDGWFGTFMILRAYNSGHIEWDLYYELTLLIISFVFLIYITLYFWRLRSTPEFHVLFIERKEEQKQIDTKHFFMLALIPVSVIIGLTSAWLSLVLLSLGWQSLLHTLWWSLEHVPLSVYPLLAVECTKILGDFLSLNETALYPFTVGQYPLRVGHILYPVIAVICSSIVFYFGYLIKPERVKRSVPRLLSIVLILAIFSTLYGIVIDVFRWYELAPWPWGFIGPPPPIGSPLFLINISIFGYRALFMASIIVLLYITYHTNVKDSDVSTLAEGKHLRSLIEEGVAILPKRVREDDSHSILLDLTPSKEFVERDSQADFPYKSSDYLEAEIQTIGRVAGGEKRLKCCETSPLPTITWLVSFRQRGIHTINLKISVIRPPDQSRDVVFMHQHTVKVDSLLSISWAPVLAFIMPILVAVVQVLLKEGL
jgi:hypothetical protein